MLQDATVVEVIDRTIQTASVAPASITRVSPTAMFVVLLNVIATGLATELIVPEA
jgi:hypothetical protein